MVALGVSIWHPAGVEAQDEDEIDKVEDEESEKSELAPEEIRE